MLFVAQLRTPIFTLGQVRLRIRQTDMGAIDRQSALVGGYFSWLRLGRHHQFNRSADDLEPMLFPV